MRLNTKRTFGFFWKHVKNYKFIALVLLLILILAVSVNMVAPYFYKIFFDTLVLGNDRGLIAAELVRIILIILGVNGVAWLLWRCNSFLNHYFQPRIMADIADECFEYLHGHSYNFFNSSFTGSLVKRVSRLMNAFEGIADRIYWDLIPLTLRVVIIFSVLFWFMEPVIGLVMLGWTLLFIILNYSFSVYKLKYDVAKAEADTKTSAVLADTVTNNVNIKLFAAAAYELNKFRMVTTDWFRKTKKSWDMGGIAEAMQVALMILFEFLIFYFAIKFWLEGRMTIGDFALIQAYIVELLTQLWNFGRIVRDIYERLADAEEMIVILHTPHEVRDVKNAKPLVVKHGNIEFKNVSFGYKDDDDVVVKNLSFKIKTGQKVALIGPSGGGKTTVTRLLLRFFNVNKGKILVDGQDISKVSQGSLRSQVALVPQDPILFHRTLKENIRYGRLEASDQEVMEAAKMAYCHDFIMKFPKGYDTYVGERGVKLSGGERQRVAIARAILANAPIIILDEATSSLDSESEILIQEALLNLMKQRTTLVIAHRLSTIMRMDRIIVFKEGRIVEEGCHGDLVMLKDGLYKKLWNLQVGGYVEG